MLKQSGNSKKNGDEGTKVFGVAIQTSAEQGGKGIPTVLQDCMQYLRMLGDMTLQLFFTHPDSMKDVEDLQKMYDRGESPDLNYYDPKSVAALFLLYFQLLPVPICTFRLCPLFINIAQTPDEETRLGYYMHVIAALPPLHNMVLKKLLLFLNRTLENGGMMQDASTRRLLATVFGFSILKAQDMQTTRRDTEVIYSIVEEFIVFAPQIIGGFQSKYYGVAETIASNERLSSAIANSLRYREGEFIFLHKQMESSKYGRGELKGYIGIYDIAHTKIFMYFKPPVEDDPSSSTSADGEVKRPPPRGARGGLHKMKSTPTGLIMPSVPPRPLKTPPQQNKARTQTLGVCASPVTKTPSTAATSDQTLTDSDWEPATDDGNDEDSFSENRPVGVATLAERMRIRNQRFNEAEQQMRDPENNSAPTQAPARSISPPPRPISPAPKRALSPVPPPRALSPSPNRAISPPPRALSPAPRALSPRGTRLPPIPVQSGSRDNIGQSANACCRKCCCCEEGSSEAWQDNMMTSVTSLKDTLRTLREHREHLEQKQADMTTNLLLMSNTLLQLHAQIIATKEAMESRNV